MSSDLLNAAHEELNGLFERTQAALDPWTSGLAKALEELATRRIRIPHGGTRGMTSAPTPTNLTAADLLDQTPPLARMLAATAGLHYGRSMGVHGLLKGLDRDDPCATFATVLLLIAISKWCDHHHF